MNFEELKRMIAEGKQKAALEPHSKYIKRGVLERERELKYLREKEETERQRQQRGLGKQLPKSTRSSEDTKDSTEGQKRDPGGQVEEEHPRKLDEKQSPPPSSSKAKLVEDKDKEDTENAVDYSFSSLETAKIVLDANPDSTYNLVCVYLKRLLREWELDLEGRSETEALSSEGKMAGLAFRQTKEYLNPFFKKLVNKKLPPDVSDNIVGICSYMQQREYLKAYDVYLKLSIGNAAWPIGVTMVGIHERSAREKIHSNQVAHVLNDETQRKWIQSIKRLMTFAQKKYPPADITKLVG